MLKEFPYGAAPTEPGRARLLTATVLHGAGVLLSQLARQLLPGRREPAGDPVLEFYAQAGAPEGALYLDGQYIGTLPGVMRL